MLELSSRAILLRLTVASLGIAIASLFLIGTPVDILTIPVSILLQCWIIYFVCIEKIVVAGKGLTIGISISSIVFNAYLFLGFHRFWVEPLYFPGAFLRGKMLLLILSHIVHGMLLAGIFYTFNLLRTRLQK